MHTLAINYAHAALRLCLQCTQDSSTWDHAHTHLLRHISAQNALKTVPRQITYALAAWYFCSNCTQNSFTWDHAHTCTCCITSLLKMHSKQLHVRSQTHLLHDIFAQNALKTASRQITNAPAAWHFCSKCTQNSSRWAWLHWFRGQPAGRSWSRSTAASPKHRPKPRLIPVRVLERRGCAWLPWWDLYSDINIVAQLRLQSIVPSHAWFLCVCWREEGVLDFDGETYTVILIS